MVNNQLADSISRSGRVRAGQKFAEPNWSIKCCPHDDSRQLPKPRAAGRSSLIKLFQHH